LAFRSKRRFRRRSGGRTRKLRWTGDILTDFATTNSQALATLDLLLPADYELNPLLEQGGGARFERLVGALTLWGIVANAQFAACIIAVDSAAGGGIGFGAFGDPKEFQTLRDGDVVWWTCGIVPVSTAANGCTPLRIEWDIRVKRKLEDTRFVLVITNDSPAATPILWYAGFRMLLANI